MIKIIETLEKYLLYIAVVLMAIFVLPQFSAAYIVPKEIILVAVVALSLVLLAVKIIIKGGLSFAIGKFDLGVLLIGIAYLISALLKTPNKLEAFFVPGTATFILASVIIYFLINQVGKKAKSGVAVAVFISGLILSLSVLFTQLGLFAKVPQLPGFIKDSAFNPMGGTLASIMYLAVTVALIISLAIREGDTVKRIFFAVSGAVIIFAGVMLTVNALPGKPQATLLPGLGTSWEVTVETLKNSPIWGVGPANFLTAFNLYRPFTYNQTDLWSIRFTTAGNYYFTIMTEVGFAGILAFAILLYSLYKSVRSAGVKKLDEYAALIVLLILFAVLPSAPALTFLLFVLLALSSKSEENIVSLNMVPAGAKSTGFATRIPSIISAIPILAAVTAVAFFGTKAVIAEATYKKSLDALARNNAKDTYNLMVSAINQNPNADRYHASLAQLDMSLATAIASNKSITDTDKQNISQLIQQAISEGKATVALNPQRSGNWQVLGQIYRSIMPFAQGADQFTIQTYTQAISLDPIDPNLRITLGGTYYALGNYDSAIDSFKLAILAKPDLANAHYNLAIAYRDKKDYTDAITEMNTVLTLVKSGTADYTLAKSTLDDLQKNQPAPAKTSATGQSLTTPTTATTTIKPPITLPQEATPPAAQQ